MISITEPTLVLVTAPDMTTARELAKAALESRLAACANLFPQVESHYWWQGKLEASAEVLMVFKTTSERLADLEQLIISRHPYDTPEFISLPITHGNPRYLNWIQQSLTESG
jgi:periplasmic divalent cation tolerance protein